MHAQRPHRTPDGRSTPAAPPDDAEIARIRARQEHELDELRRLMATRTATMAPRRVVSVGEGCHRDATYLAACRYLGAFSDQVELLVPVDVQAGPGSFHELGPTRLAGAPSTPLVGDASRAPFADGAADLVVSSLMIDDVADPAAVVEDLARITAPRGHLMIAGHGHDVQPHWRGVRGILGAFHPHQVTTAHIDAWLSTIGATVTERWHNTHTWLRVASPPIGSRTSEGWSRRTPDPCNPEDHPSS